MNAPAKVTKAKDDAPATMKLWNAVSKTDPRHTKRVNQRGGFTAIDAHYQIMLATEQFGPIGEGWGYTVGDYSIVGPMIVVPVTLWHGKRDNCFGPILGCAEIMGQRPDRDAPKKAMTDGLTKGLSQLGFNADVFLGLFDDNKYVEQVTREFSDGPPPKKQPLSGPYTSKTALWAAVKAFDRTVRGIGDHAELLTFLDIPESKELIEQCKRDAPGLWSEGLPDIPEFVPLEILIADRKRDLEQIENIHDKPNILHAG